MARKKYRRVERQYVVDYVINRFPGRITAFFNLRLGPPPAVLQKLHPDLPAQYFKVWHRYADAVVITDDAVVLIEAKVHNPRTGIGYLLDYSQLLNSTPELKPYLNRPVRLQLVVPVPDPILRSACEQSGIEFVQYLPEWLKPILREKNLI